MSIHELHDGDLFEDRNFKPVVGGQQKRTVEILGPGYSMYGDAYEVLCLETERKSTILASRLRSRKFKKIDRESDGS